MSEKENEEEINVEIKPGDENLEDESETANIEQSTTETDLYESEISELNDLLSKQKQNLAACEDKLKRSLADFQNLEKKTVSDIQNGINVKMDQFMKKFLDIYDDFVCAKGVMVEENVNVTGLEMIIKKIESLLSEYEITPINALGEIFDPNLHDAVSVVEDSTLDDGTITKEIRKGYISQKRVIRPAKVEVSKKSNSVKENSE